MNQAERLSLNQTVKEESIVYRDQKNRYPWWVRTVDTITTETDDARLKKPDEHVPVASKETKAGKKKKRRLIVSKTEIGPGHLFGRIFSFL